MPMLWHGRSGENYVTVDASTFTLVVNEVDFAFYVYNAAPWQWDATGMNETLYSQHINQGTFANDPACPTLNPPPPPNYVGSAGCKRILPVGQMLTGANAKLNIVLYTFDPDAVLELGGSLSFLHKIHP